MQGVWKGGRDVGARVGGVRGMGVERGWQEMAGEVVGDKGEGEEWLRRLDERRQVYGGMVV